MASNNFKLKNLKKEKNKTLKKKITSLLNQKFLVKKYPLLLSLKKNYKYSYSFSKMKKLKKMKNFRIIGMGGSILGAQAIYSFLKYKIKKNFTFINNLNPKLNLDLKKKYVNIIISKSGNTLETISNTTLLIKNNTNLLITEKNENYLSRLSQKIKCEIFEHKNFIGGRYSVLSEVGMLPAELMGLDARKFKKFNELIKNKKFLNNLINNCIFIYKAMKRGVRNSIILNYDQNSHEFLEWYQQLTAESLGKNMKGVFPSISIMPKDNHSLLQLYLDGPKVNFFTFFSVKEINSQRLINEFLFDEMKKLKNKSLYDLLNYQKIATENIFKKKRLPFRSFEIISRNEDVLGELFTFFILETIILAELMNVNALNQPSVELVKKETSRLLDF